VNHGDTRTTYEPVLGSVSVGDRIPAGTVIGALERVGSHCFPASCLHWGWVRDHTYLDPLRLVGGGPIRLLPLWRDEPVPRLPGAQGRSARPLPRSARGWATAPTSGARVGLLEGATQPIGGDVGITLRRRE
jgi:hypothetical protein